MRTIIPAAGFGTRMNMKPNESKEMLPDESGRPMIQWALDIAINPLVITRPEKIDLIEYLNENSVQYIITPPTKEWPETILKSRPYWDDHNILLLPDTRFKYGDYPGDVIKLMDKRKDMLSFACHEVRDASKWGIVRGKMLYEKPKFVVGVSTAWGLIGFSRFLGGPLFKDILKRGEYRLQDYHIIMLDEFKDITRGE